VLKANNGLSAGLEEEEFLLKKHFVTDALLYAEETIKSDK
jgi:hypothetical protein